MTESLPTAETSVIEFVNYLPTLGRPPTASRLAMVRLTEDMIVARTRVSDMAHVKKLNCWYVVGLLSSDSRRRFFVCSFFIIFSF